MDTSQNLAAVCAELLQEQPTRVSVRTYNGTELRMSWYSVEKNHE